MTSKFNIGDVVVITGPTHSGNTMHMGKTFKIDQVTSFDGDRIYSTFGFPWFPESSLELYNPEYTFVSMKKIQQMIVEEVDKRVNVATVKDVDFKIGDKVVEKEKIREVAAVGHLGDEIVYIMLTNGTIYSVGAFKLLQKL